LLLVCALCALATVVITAVAAVPAHAALADGYDRAVWRRLQRAHALRTGAWTLAALASTVAVILRFG
jgi:predicted amidohydrolase